MGETLLRNQSSALEIDAQKTCNKFPQNTHTHRFVSFTITKYHKKPRFIMSKMQFISLSIENKSKR